MQQTEMMDKIAATGNSVAKTASNWSEIDSYFYATTKAKAKL
jgi:hypothetical protein